MPSCLSLRLLLPHPPFLLPPSAVSLIGREGAAIGAAVVGSCSFSRGNGNEREEILMKSEILGFLFSSSFYCDILQLFKNCAALCIEFHLILGNNDRIWGVLIYTYVNKDYIVLTDC